MNQMSSNDVCRRALLLILLSYRDEKTFEVERKQSKKKITCLFHIKVAIVILLVMELIHVIQWKKEK